ncbi:hypothetical protein CPB84DRAFT_309193 [Gymnopilus junonius]|uniref:Uncharacterized protein n=1 Tax=Gymnopilus junonius TaxID=109634 RepID=A0A9P5TSC3_GYMJU|nr:hypothetical protein CPB84DRAFT_309193 [Gymnopilus junonius]
MTIPQTNSPDTFFAHVQPPTEDSEQTPPSPPSKHRRSIARPSQVQQSNSPSPQSLKRSSTSHGPSQQVRKERERQLANTPREALIQLAIGKEHDAREAKHLLASAILQVESFRDRLRREEEARRALEEETHVLGVKTTKAILDSQKETLSAKEEVGTYKLKLENVERELKRAKDVVRIVEKERDEADKALVRARTTARTLKEQNILLQAQEEGRRMGFEEGLRQGRLLQEAAMPLESEPVVVQQPEPQPKDRKRSVDSNPSSSKHTSRRHDRRSSNPSHETEAAIAALTKIHEDETLRIRSQLSKIEADLDRTIQEKKDAERERQALLELRQRAEAENQRRQLEREKERMVLEREKEELKRRDSERVRRIKEEHRRVEEEHAMELRELKKEKERLEREKADIQARTREDVERERERLKKAEEELEREKEREREREKENREDTAAAITAAVNAAIEATTSHVSSPEAPPFKSRNYQRLPYIPMPPPPVDAVPTAIVMPTSSATTPGPPFGVPLTNSVGSQRGHRRRDSSSSVASTAQYDMLQPPTGRDRGLGVIPEDASVRAPSPSHVVPASMPMPTVPDWVQDGNNDGWRSNVSFPYYTPSSRSGLVDDHPPCRRLAGNRVLSHHLLLPEAHRNGLNPMCRALLGVLNRVLHLNGLNPMCQTSLEVRLPLDPGHLSGQSLLCPVSSLREATSRLLSGRRLPYPR